MISTTVRPEEGSSQADMRNVGSNVARSRKSDRPALLLLQLQATSLGGRQPGTSQVPENQDYGREYQSAALAILSTETGSVPGAQIPLISPGGADMTPDNNVWPSGAHPPWAGRQSLRGK